MTIKHVAYRLAHGFVGGAISLAALMGKHEKVMQNKLNPNNDQHHLTVDELEMIADFTSGNIAVAEYFAGKANAVVVQLPNMDEFGDMALLDSFMDIMSELGSLSKEFQSAYADGDINKQEFKRIADNIGKAQGRLLAFQNTVQRVVR